MQSRLVHAGLVILILAAAGIGAFVLFGPPPDYRPHVEHTASATFWRKGATCTATAEEVLAIREALLSAEILGHEEYPGKLVEYLRLTLPDGDATDIAVAYFGATQGPAARYYLMGSVLQSTKLDTVMAGLRERAKAAARDDTSR